MLRTTLGLGLLAALAAGNSDTKSFNVLTMAIKPYSVGTPIGQIKVNSLFSHKDLVSLDYYSLGHCKPDETQMDAHVSVEKIGEVIWGDRIAPSVYRANMLEDVKCRVVRHGTSCANGNQLNADQLDRFARRIRHDYRGALILDNLPAISNSSIIKCQDGTGLSLAAGRGYALGVPKTCTKTDPHINNHLAIHVHVNQVEDETDLWSVVGFYVEPSSIDHAAEGGSAESCAADFDETAPHAAVTTALPVGKDTKEVIWSYSVKFHKTDLQWGRRWDAYLNLAFSNRNDKIHWLGIINSSMLILCLAAVVALILVRMLRMDILNATMDREEQQELRDESGWKMVYGDVFRTPSYPRLYAILFGTGAQVLGMVVFVFAFALHGLLSPANRGGLLTTAILLFAFMAVLNGSATALVLKMFGNMEWKPIFWASMLFPGLLLCAWVTAQIVINWHRPGYNANPVMANTMKVFALGVGVALPLALVGASAVRKSAFTLEPPVRVNPVARQVPEQPWFLTNVAVVLLPGIIPFGAAFLELRLVLSSMWQGMSYYMFGYLSLTFVTVLVVCVEITVLELYILLAYENHRWWWRALVVPAGMAIHFFMYSLYYAHGLMGIDTWLSWFIYVSTMGTMSIGMYVAMGAIGQITGYFFVRTIYSSIKSD